MSYSEQSIGQARNLQIDALNMCPPIGAIFAALGIHACVPLSHGASGCCRFQRMEIAKHFQKIIRVSSSLLREPAAIFGGEESLHTAVKNIFEAYDPQVVAIHTTCLSETIGDDLRGMVDRLQIPAGKRVLYASTPGYVGSQLTGYSAMVQAMAEQLVEPGEGKGDKVALIPGWLNPVDVEELDSYAAGFFAERLVMPDSRGVMDEKTPRNVRAYASGGVRVESVCRAADCRAAIALGAEATWVAGETLARKGMQMVARLPLPIGISATDTYVQALADISGRPVPERIKRERARLIDVLMELHPKLYGRKAAVFCDADISVPLTGFLCEIGMKPELVCTGYAEEPFEREIRSMFQKYSIDGTVLRQADRFDIERYLETHPADILLGGTRGKMLSRRFDIPLLRIGFPVIDRPLAYLDPIVGYKGCLYLLRGILNLLCEREEEHLEPEQLSFTQSF